MSRKNQHGYVKRCEIYARYNGRCTICGRHIRFDVMTVDHIVPKSKGGTNDIKNLQLACHTCNLVKGAMMPVEFMISNWKLFWRSLKSVCRFHMKLNR